MAIRSPGRRHLPPVGSSASAAGSADGSWIAASPFGLLAMTKCKDPPVAVTGDCGFVCGLRGTLFTSPRRQSRRGRATFAPPREVAPVLRIFKGLREVLRATVTPEAGVPRGAGQRAPRGAAVPPPGRPGRAPFR